MTPSQAPHAELIEKDFDGSFGIEDIQAASFEPFLPEAGFDFACPGHRKATRLDVSILFLQEYASNFKKSQIVDPVVDVVLEHIQQTGEQAGPQNVHVCTQGVFQCDHLTCHSLGRGFGNQGLSLGFVKPQTGEQGACLGKLVVDGIIGVVAMGATRRSRWDAVHSIEPGDFLDEIDLALEVHPPTGTLHLA